MNGQIMLWVGFNLFVLAMLALDLGIFHRKAHEVKFKEAMGWSIFWVGLGLTFNLGIYFFWQDGRSGYTGEQAALAFFTGYLIEKALSVDNIFVFLLIFSYFQIPAIYQHRVLFWGIIGALIMRAIFIAAGISLINQFHWMIYLFGGFLVLTGIKMWVQKDKKIEPDKNPVIRAFKRLMPVTEKLEGQRFFVRHAGKLFATPLFVALLFVEMSDLIFAVDSIPAILAITQEPFLVYTSNVFAILGLRSLYFALSGIMQMFHHLHYGLSAILVFVGGKMIVSDAYKMPVLASLGVIVLILAVSILASYLLPAEKTGESNPSPLEREPTSQTTSLL